MVNPSFPYIIFGYWLSVFLLQVPTFFPLSYAMFKKRNQLAFPFILYLFTILIESFSTLISTLYTLINWRPDSGGYEPIAVFGVGFISYSFVSVTSAAVFFLLLHRIFAVCFFNSKNYDKAFNCTSIIVVAIIIISNSTYVIIKFLEFFPKLGPTAKCWIIHCTWGEHGSAFHIWSRMIFGFANVFLGIIFLIVLKKSPANLPSKRANRLTLITIASELILSFFPTVVDILLSNCFGIYMVQTIGPLGYLTCAIDAFVVSTIYLKFFLKPQKIAAKINSNNLMH